MQIRPVGAALIHAGGQTDRQKQGHEETNRRFYDYANAPKISIK